MWGFEGFVAGIDGQWSDFDAWSVSCGIGIVGKGVALFDFFTGLAGRSSPTNRFAPFALERFYVSGPDISKIIAVFAGQGIHHCLGKLGIIGDGSW